MSIYKRSIIKLSRKIKEKRKELEDDRLKPVKELITKKRIEEICREQRYVYRERKLTVQE